LEAFRAAALREKNSNAAQMPVRRRYLRKVLELQVAADDGTRRRICKIAVIAFELRPIYFQRTNGVSVGRPMKPPWGGSRGFGGVTLGRTTGNWRRNSGGHFF